jgi:hypothetical protein
MITDEVLSQDYRLGKGTLRWGQDGQALFVAWYTKTGALGYRQLLEENGSYMVTPSQAWRTYTEEEERELAVQALARQDAEQQAGAYERRVQAAGRESLRWLRQYSRITELRPGQVFHGEEIRLHTTWHSDGQIDRAEPQGDVTTITISGATWAYRTVGNKGMVGAAVIWGDTPAQLIEHLGDREVSLRAAERNQQWDRSAVGFRLSKF